MEQRLLARFEEIVGTNDSPSHVVVNRWYFTSANFMPRSVPHALWLAVRRLLPATLLRPRAMSVLTTGLAHHGMRYFEQVWRNGPARRYADAVASAQRAMEGAEHAELVHIVDELSDLAGDELFYFLVVGGSAWKVEVALARFYTRHVIATVGGNHQDLLTGLGGVDGPRGHAVFSLDWFHATSGELGLDAEVDGGAVRQAATQRVREASVDRARNSLRSPRRRKRFDVLLERAQHFGRVREEQAARLTLAWPILRQCIRRIADPLVSIGLLRTGDDAYFATRDELLAPSKGLAELTADRGTVWSRARRLVPPEHLGELTGIRALILRGAARALGATEDGTGLHGAPASAGRAEGHVRIIRSPLEFDRLKRGEILVAPATSPAWTPLFARAAAVVTDTGSAMAHASLVAREYGIPAVVGTGNATTRLREGQWIIVDGNVGRVYAPDSRLSGRAESSHHVESDTSAEGDLQ
jgi:rifampicin phosphotransferase